MEDKLGRKIRKKFLALGAKSYSYLLDNNDEDKKVKEIRKLKFEDHNNCLEATQLENKINQLEEYKVDKDRLRENDKEVIKNDKLILKSQQGFRNEKHVYMYVYLLKKLTRLH